MAGENDNKGAGKDTSNPPVITPKTSDWFSQLDRYVAGSGGPPSPDLLKKKPDESGTPAEKKSVESRLEELETELKKAKDGYKGSSKEALKLKTERDLLKQELAKSKDSNILGKKVPKDVFEALGIDRANFVFDMDDVKNPQSNSAKVFSAMVALEASRQTRRILDERDSKKSETFANVEFENQRKSLIEKLKWTEDEFSEWWEGAKKSPITLEGIYFATNQEELLNKASKEIQEQAKRQRADVSNLPSSLAEKGGGGEFNFEDAFFDKLQGIKSDVDLSHLPT